MHGPTSIFLANLTPLSLQALVSRLAEFSEFRSRFRSTGAHEVLGYMAPMASMQIRELHLELEPAAPAAAPEAAPEAEKPAAARR
jgi:hypothetical protein